MGHAYEPEKAQNDTNYGNALGQPAPDAPDPNFEDGYIVDEKGVVSVVKTRSGYAPVPPQGYRLANAAEIEAYKATQGQGEG